MLTGHVWSHGGTHLSAFITRRLQLEDELFDVLDAIPDKDVAGMQIRLLMLLLNSEQWRYFPLTVQVLSTDFSKLLHGVNSPPDHVSILYGPAEVWRCLLSKACWLLVLLPLNFRVGRTILHACMVATID